MVYLSHGRVGEEETGTACEQGEKMNTGIKSGGHYKGETHMFSRGQY